VTVAEALAARDAAAIERLLAPDAVFHSPVADYAGRELALRLLTAVAQVFDSLEVVSELSRGDEERVSFVRATLGGAQLDGAVRELRRDELVYDVTLMARPLDALERAIERMQSLLG
jgi:ketosteroid isomerase-like protein